VGGDVDELLHFQVFLRQFLVRLFEAFPGLFAFGEIALYGDEGLDFLVFIENRGNGELGVIARTIFPAVDDFAGPNFSGKDGGPHLSVELGRLLSGIEDAGIFSDDLGSGVPGEVGEGGIDKVDGAFGIGHKHCFTCRFDAAGKLAEAFPGLFAFGDVAEESGEDGAVGVARSVDGKFDGKLCAVAAEGGHFDMSTEEVAAAGVEVAFQPLMMGFTPSLRNDYFRKVLAEHFLTGVAEGVLGGGIEFGDASGVIHRDDAIEGRFDDGAVVDFAFVEGFGGAVAVSEI